MLSVTREVGQLDRRAATWLAILCGLALGAIVFSIRYPTGSVGLDFQAFWCGGHTIVSHASPYLNQPLHACEAAHSPAFFAEYKNLTIPVPLPPYALALFVPLSLVPYGVARVIWWLLLAAAAFAVGRGISRTTSMPAVTGIAISFLAVLGPAIFPGALAPIAIALTVWAAAALQERRWNRATMLLGFAMIEPHMVLPACLAVFVLMPPMRIRLLVAAGLAALISLLAVGPVTAASYVTAILPTHALAEVNNLAQYSLTAFLYHLGVTSQIAVRIGSAQYALFVVLSVLAATRLYRLHRDPAWLVLIPAGFAVVGGPFIHLDQVVMVIPMACLMIRARPSAIPVAILVLLATPAEVVINWLPFALPGALICGWLVAAAGAHWTRVVGASAAVVVGSCAVAAFILALPHTASAKISVDDPGATASASIAWGQFTAHAMFLPWVWWPEKLLTLLPVLAVVALTLREAFGKIAVPEASVPPRRLVQGSF